MVSLISLVTLFALAWGPPPGQRGGQLTGKVTGLAGADHVVIRVEGPETYRTTTRFQGRWDINGVLPGRYTVTPYHNRYRFEPQSRVVVVAEEPVLDLDFEAIPAHVAEPGDRAMIKGEIGPWTKEDRNEPISLPGIPARRRGNDCARLRSARQD